VKKLIPGVLLYLNALNLSADTDLIIKDPNNYLHYRILLNSRELLREQKNGLWVNQGKLTFSNIDLRDFKVLVNQTFEVKGNILISIEGTGQLYRINLKELSLIRVDNTFFRGYNFWAIKFIRKDTLCSLGGSGFWHFNNIETFFSNKTKEWELLNVPLEDGPQQISRAFGGYDKKRDIISVIESPPFYGKLNKEFPYKYFEKNTAANEWKLLGEVNSKLLFKLGVKRLNSIFVNGIYLFLDGDYFLFADPIENKIFFVEKNLPLFNLINEISENRGFLFTYSKEKHYKDSQLKIDSISFEKLKSLGIPKGYFYIKDDNGLLLYTISGLIIVCILSIYLFKSNKKKAKNEQLNEFEESRLKDVLPLGSYEFLISCLQYSKGYEFSTNKMNELMGFENYSFESQRKVRSKFINSINSYFKFYHKMDTVIVRKISNEDKRMSLYLISVVYYDRLKILTNDYNNLKI